MGLKELLSKKRDAVLKRWLQLILETYPADTSGLLGQEMDPFVNPVGSTIAGEIRALYEGLLRGEEVDRFSNHLDKVIQIRSVQDFSPSRAVLVVPLLKRAIQEELARSRREGDRLMEELFDLDSKIDQLSLLAFDIYTKYRERVYEIRIGEIKKERDRLLKLWERVDPNIE
jgi:hypothetical protein